MTAFFKPDPPVPVSISDPAEIRAQFRRWRFRVLSATIAGYALFYFVRANLPVAMPDLKKSLGLTNAKLGLFLTLSGLLYGVSKFANGYLGDRSDARALMAVGLAGSALLNICFGLNSAVVALGVVWMLNGWFQGMGYPPCARLITHWFAPRELATKMSLWNISHQIGGGLIVILCGYLVAQWGWLVSGWLTDRFFGGRAMRVAVVYMALAGFSVYLLWKMPGETQWINTALFCAAGFFIYGPQCLVAIAAANLATKRAAATAVGLTSIFGYASTVLSGWGIGQLLDHYGWDAVFKCLLVVVALGVIIFLAAWPAKAHGYDE